jgi:hypothetical protein
MGILAISALALLATALVCLGVPGFGKALWPGTWIDGVKKLFGRGQAVETQVYVVQKSWMRTKPN